MTTKKDDEPDALGDDITGGKAAPDPVPENTPSLECRGYVTEDAARIGVNVILYALQQ